MLDHQEILTTLFKITQELTKNNIKYWLDGGTLLGLYRDGKIMEHDNDVDLGVFYNTDTTQVKKIILNLGYPIENEKEGRKLTFRCPKFSIDIWGFYGENEKQYWHRAWGVGFYFKKEILDNLVLLTIDNMSFYIPSNTETYLYEIYGEGWKVPNPNFRKPEDYKNYKSV